MSNNQHTTFSTDSFNLASYLLCESCKLISIDKTNPKRMVFIFEKSDQMDDLTEKFFSHQALIEPHKLFSALRDLKQLLYQKIAKGSTVMSV